MAAQPRKPEVNPRLAQRLPDLNVMHKDPTRWSEGPEAGVRDDLAKLARRQRHAKPPKLPHNLIF